MKDFNKKQIAFLKRVDKYADEQIKASLKAIESCADCSPRIDTLEDRVLVFREIKEAIPSYILNHE